MKRVSKIRAAELKVAKLLNSFYKPDFAGLTRPDPDFLFYRNGILKEEGKVFEGEGFASLAELVKKTVERIKKAYPGSGKIYWRKLPEITKYGTAYYCDVRINIK